MVISLIAVHGRPLWVSVLVYATVLVTVLSGADYFFGLRRRLSARVAAQGTASSQARRVV
jgi:CDP-diacylglycerol--glycerol-3-phosphate 3-phosphatidyltransferase